MRERVWSASDCSITVSKPTHMTTMRSRPSKFSMLSRISHPSLSVSPSVSATTVAASRASSSRYGRCAYATLSAACSGLRSAVRVSSSGTMIAIRSCRSRSPRDLDTCCIALMVCSTYAEVHPCVSELASKTNVLSGGPVALCCELVSSFWSPSWKADAPATMRCVLRTTSVRTTSTTSSFGKSISAQRKERGHQEARRDKHIAWEL
eukprot:scaffold310584_cov28-Tisochrysis_lutea.AAC.1